MGLKKEDRVENDGNDRILIPEREEKLWGQVCRYAQECSWSGGKYLAEDMRRNLSGWERVIVLTCGGEIAGYCAVLKRDCINDVPYTPYIGYVFVGESFRGRGFSGKLVRGAEAYLKRTGFGEAYIVSRHDGLYEKYGYVHVDTRPAYWGEMQKIYRHIF